jgi:hypothetical protein
MGATRVNIFKGLTLEKYASSGSHRLVFLILVSLLVGCQAPSLQNPPPTLPQPPDETLAIELIYPPAPVFLNAQGFRHALNELSNQLTLLYIQTPLRPLPADELTAVVAIQKRFYRYGLRVLFIDLNTPEHWPSLKNQLESAGANFPVAYIDRSSGDWLNSCLHTGPICDNQLYIIDAGRPGTEQILPVPKPWTIAKLSVKVKQFLTARASGNARSEKAI